MKKRSSSPLRGLKMGSDDPEDIAKKVLTIRNYD